MQSLFLALTALLFAACAALPSSPAATPLFPANAPAAQAYPPPQETATPGAPYPAPPTPAASQPPTASPTAASTLPAQISPTPGSAAGSPTPTIAATPVFSVTPIVSPTLPLAVVPPADLPSHPPSTAPVSIGRTLTLWHSWDAAQTRTLEHIVLAFQQMQPDVYFDILYVPPDQLLARFNAESARGAGADVLLAPAAWGAALFDERYIADLSPYISDEFIATPNPMGVAACIQNDRIVCLPYALHGALLFRNRQIIAEPPATLEALIAAARAATRGGVVGADLDRGIYFSAAHLIGMGGSLWSSEDLPAFNTAEGIAWLEMLVAFEQAGPVEFNGHRDTELFMQGKAGMILDGSWNLDNLAQAIGAENLAIDPWPAAGSGRLAGFVEADALYLNINLSGQEQLDALRFIGFFLTPEAQAVLADAGMVPALAQAPVRNPLIQQAMVAFGGGVAYPNSAAAQVYLDTLEAALRDVISGSASIETALQWAYDTIRFRLTGNPDPD